MQEWQYNVLDADSGFVLRGGIFAVHTVLMETHQQSLVDGLTTLRSCIQRRPDSSHELLDFKRNLKFLRYTE